MSSSILITWNDNNTVHQGYKIYKSEVYFDKDSLPVPVADVSSGTNQYTDNDVAIGKKYWYRIGTYTPHHVVLSEAVLLEITEEEV